MYSKLSTTQHEQKQYLNTRAYGREVVCYDGVAERRRPLVGSCSLTALGPA